jgi:RTA1 like protein
MIYQVAKYISPGSARFAPVLFYYIFIPCDITSLVLQATGGALSSTSNGSNQTGVNIALAGLCFQVVTLVVFIVAAVDYAILSRGVWMLHKPPMRFLVFCAALALATILILVRCCYRVYELSEGYSRNSIALRDQSLFDGLEGVYVPHLHFFLTHLNETIADGSIV